MNNSIRRSQFLLQNHHHFPYFSTPRMLNRLQFMRIWSRVLVCLCFSLLQSAQRSHSFVLFPPCYKPLALPRAVPAITQHAAVVSFSRKSTTAPLFMLPPLSTTKSIWTPMQVFDGSSIVIDPVEISEIFWTCVKGKLIVVMIGPLLATAVFGALSWLVMSQPPPLSNNNKATTNILTSPRFTNPTVTRAVSPNITPNLGKLLICLLIDVMGSLSAFLPTLGELTDVVYAPIAATVLRNMYRSNNILFELEFLEEILPFTDFLPLPTIW
jgi:hypothetical protein